jgi:hypothetical protein
MLKSSAPAEHIPFVGTQRDADLLDKHFADSEIVRVSLVAGEKIANALTGGPKVWVDAGIDGLHKWPANVENERPFEKYMSQFPGVDLICDVAFQKKPDRGTVQKFVNSVLDACGAVKPAWISIPQLPVVEDSGRNRINRELAEASREWVLKTRFAGLLVLPMIFTHQSQVNRETARNPKVVLLQQCYLASGAHIVWTVDRTLMDQDGSKSLEDIRFPGVVSLHREILAQLPPDAVIIGGPYWGLNIVLWAKGLIRYLGIGLGNQFQYHSPGGYVQQGKTRIALASLKRWVVVSPALQTWLSEALKVVPPGDPAHAEFAKLQSTFSALLRGSNRHQVASTYKAWFDSVAQAPAAGRTLTLYQQLSSAYVLGKSLPDLPKDEDARRPERVAQQLMLVCL